MSVVGDTSYYHVLLAKEHMAGSKKRDTGNLAHVWSHQTQVGVHPPHKTDHLMSLCKCSCAVKDSPQIKNN